MADMIHVLGSLAIPPEALSESYVRASGPGGQHVNTTASAVELRFDPRRAPGFPETVFARLQVLAGQRMTRDGVVVIRAEEHRSQALNRTAALERLLALLRAAAVRKPVRRPTRPTLASKERRLRAKGVRGSVKSTRRDKGHHDSD